MSAMLLLCGCGKVLEKEVVPETATETQAYEEMPQTTAETQVYEEMKQCPYCANWFSALPDGDVASPYERHIQEERASDPAGGQTEQEMVQCPDCGNLYEAGNVFRNHICEGRKPVDG